MFWNIEMNNNNNMSSNIKESLFMFLGFFST